MKALFDDISLATLDLVFPVRCQGCGIKLPYDNRLYLCHGCMTKISLNNPPFCIRCGRVVNGPGDLKTVCPDCLKRRYHFRQAWQCCRYDGLIKELIHKFKYSHKIFIKGLFIDIMADFAKAHLSSENINAVIGVPMHRRNMIDRGADHAQLLADGLALRIGVPSIKGSLSKTRRTAQQAGLSRRERLLNLKDSFCASYDRQVKGRTILLVDDIFTTGATADECSKALLASGAGSVITLAVARGL